MKRFMDELKHAFAVEKPESLEPDAAQAAIIDRLCSEIAKRRLTTPALMLLEMSRPLNFVGAQAMHFFTPLVSAVTDTSGFEQFAMFLEKPGSIEFLCKRIEHYQDEQEQGADATRQATSDDSSAPRDSV